ncbi:HAD family hydrolase [Gordoniibacillus kamchatkensis]|uniref:HAD family hydrolase n=1 Tax=Gordoniibacillus kamchatkensis TaxID=1590651 RepID=A0ABR5AJP0_9BACL|nr:HAD-IC family P-type ATPase [Paenibacillus sp. VKM B-2647]KIL41264.1 HAD family hydrolase [Paenibacillus sp. VKM B-2647]
MSATASKERFLRLLPGRLRIEVFGLLRNEQIANTLAQSFASLKGVTKVEPCAVTGRMLVVYDERKVPVDEIFRRILAVERQVAASGQTAQAAEGDSSANAAGDPVDEAGSEMREQRSETEIAQSETEIAQMEAAPASESETQMEESPADAIVSDEIAEAIRTIPKAVGPPPSPEARVPLPLTLAMGGLVALGAKQLLFGRSALARSPIPFYLSGAVAVLTGYPFLRRGVTEFSRQKQINADLILGTGALALALVRENLVVLAGLSILQYVNWKRSRQVPDGLSPVELSPEIRDYSEKAGKLGIAAAAATWALTRDPLRGIAVLLAANPRPATIPAECAWKQAEVKLQEQGVAVPIRSSLAQLARTKTLLLEDTSLLVGTKVHETGCTSRDDDPDKVICTAASLMEKTDHPWKEPVWQKAKSTCRTLRTAFRVEEEDGGIKGTIQNAVYSVGTMAYCQRAGIACESYYLEAKRLQKQGFDVLFVAKHTNQGAVCQGLIYREQQITAESRQLLQRLYDQGFTVAPLRDGAEAGIAGISGLGLSSDWLSMEEGEIVERVASLHQQGEDMLLITGQEPNERSRYLEEAGVPSVRFGQLEPVLAACNGVRHMESTVHEHLRIAKSWNIFGSVLASLGVLSAPIVNLASDALSLMFMSRSQNRAQTAFADTTATSTNEVAAAAEAVSWHAAPWEYATDAFAVNERFGLTQEQVRVGQSRFGLNTLERKKPTPWLFSYLGQFKEFTTLVLLGTSALALFTGGVFDGLAMGAVLLANAAIGTYQERKAEQVLQNLNQFQPPETTVIRNGEQVRMSAAELVPGDIVGLEAGDRVPADLRIIASQNLEVNEAALTGESVPVAKTDVSVTEDCPLSERNNMLYMGTDVTRGKALAVVVQTGMNTEIGHLMALLKQEEKEVTPLQEKVTAISKKFVKWALIAGALVFVTGLMRGIPVREMITTSITLAASAIPEGLPVTITIALSAGIFRMAKKHVLVRKLSALETLGRTTVICSDKTGTLTKNEMTVRELATVDHRWTVSGNGYEPVGSIDPADGAAPAHNAPGQTETPAGLQPELDRIMQIAVLCNNSKLQPQDDAWTVQGDPTEGALLSLAAKAGLRPEHLANWHRCEEIPFDSNTATMSVVCKDTGAGDECYLFSKGAVENILRECSSYQSNGEVLPLTDEIRSKIIGQNEKLAAEALRVLGFACLPLGANADRSPGSGDSQMIYIGMAGMIDPPKPDVEKSIREAYELGVKPIMITGDHPITAIAIAKQIGIYDDSRQVLSGHEMDRMTDEELDPVVEQVSIFARVTPEHKLRIVKALQRRGHIVAMTGDGVNDTPAIKQANVGVAMGRTGTDVTKETADMVLQEDHFGAIVEGVKEGRTIIGNIRKALGCLLTGNLAEILVTSAAVMAGMPIPLVPIQILLMNLLTDALPAMVLAVNPGSKRKETKRADIADKQLYQKVVTRGVLLGLGSLGLFAYTLASGAPVQVAQSVAFTTLVAGQLMQTFSWRQEGSEESIRDIRKDRFMAGALGVSWLALLSALYVPPVARIFHTAPLSLGHWAMVLTVGASISLLSKPILAVLSAKGHPAGTEPAAIPSYAAA